MIKVLSLHFTDKCTRRCLNCYMRQKTGRRKNHDFFLKFPKIAKDLRIKQIALGGGEPSLYPEFIEEFGKGCKKNKVIVNMTTNGDGISEDNIEKFRYLTLISFSFDRFKIHSKEDADRLFQKIDLAKNHKIKVGVNLQLDPFLAKNLNQILADIFKHADSVYLLQSKPSCITCDQELKNKILVAKSTFKRVYIDESLRMSLGFSKSCNRGREIISIDHTGKVYKCSFDEPIARLKRPEELISIVRKEYPFTKTNACPFV
jgi:MoaA/NifB/PqqE/SkfB family radical SAM enzyme